METIINFIKRQKNPCIYYRGCYRMFQLWINGTWVYSQWTRRDGYVVRLRLCRSFNRSTHVSMGRILHYDISTWRYCALL